MGNSLFTESALEEQLLGAYIYKEGVVYPEGARIVRKKSLPEPNRVYGPNNGIFCDFVENRLNICYDGNYKVTKI